MLTLRPYQEKSLESLRNGFKSGHKTQILYMPTGGGKCLAKGTKVIMSDGTKKNVEDIKVSDVLLGADGREVVVKSTVYGYDDLYKVTPNKGESYIVNKDHILSLKITGNKSKTVCNQIRYSPGDIANIPVLEYINSSKTFKHCSKAWWPDHQIEFFVDKKELPIPSYILGAWLGDGSIHSPSISGIDQEIITAWSSYADSIGQCVHVDDQPNKCNSYHITNGQCGGRKRNKLTDALKSLCLYKCKEKFIPYVYKTSGVQERLQLLAGLIDTDGSLSKGYYDIVLKSKALADDIAFVSRSLGFQSIVKECLKEATNGSSGKKTYYRLSICGYVSIIPCKVPRKQAETRKQKKSVNVSGLSVEYVGKGNYYGFELIGEYKLFLLNDFQVTHNTESALSLLLAAANKGNRAAMILDRRILVDQTSARLDKYGIEHGVLMAGHWRWRPHENIQICSAQTLEKCEYLPDLDLIIVDEAHTVRAHTKNIINNLGLRAIGLTASPFTKGLGSLYQNIVSDVTTGNLVDTGALVPLKVFVAKEIDMTGAKKVAGEWSQSEATKRGIQITGDIVSEWVSKTFAFFGKPEKTIVFCAGVAHGEDLQRRFNECGYNFVSISYRDDEQYKRDVIDEFAKPDTSITGLIATDVLTKGFDCPDVKIGISARPFSKSFSSHVQQMGRVMRSSPGKSFALWLDHAGNFLRFKDDWDDLYANGVSALDDGKEKPKKELTDKEKEAAKCPKCYALWPPKSDTCSNCGHVRQRQNDVQVQAGELVELHGQTTKKDEKYSAVYKESFYQQLLKYAAERGYKDGWAYHFYVNHFKVQPRWEKTAADFVSKDVLNLITYYNIKKSYRRKS